MTQNKLNHILFDAWINSSLANNQNTYLVFIGEVENSPYMLELNKLIDRYKISF